VGCTHIIISSSGQRQNESRVTSNDYRNRSLYDSTSAHL